MPWPVRNYDELRSRHAGSPIGSPFAYGQPTGLSALRLGLCGGAVAQRLRGALERETGPEPAIGFSYSVLRAFRHARRPARIRYKAWLPPNQLRAPTRQAEPQACREPAQALLRTVAPSVAPVASGVEIEHPPVQ